MTEANGRLFRMAAPPFVPFEPVLERLNTLRAPVLVLIGERDTPGLREAAGVIAQKVSGARLVTIAGADHALPIGWDAEANEIIMEFLSGRDRADNVKERAAAAFAEVLSTGDVARAGDFYDPAFVNHGLQRGLTLAEDMQALRGWHEAFPDLRMDIQQVIAEDDLVCVLWIAEGTNTGAGAGLPATGKQARLRGITIWRIVDGKITEEWSSFDQLSLLKQLGLFPAG